MARPEIHPLYDVAARDKSLVLTATDAGVVRLTDRETGLWIMIASEDGSIMDRWADSEGSPFLRLDAGTVAGGTKAILAAIDDARRTAQPRESSLVVRKSEPSSTVARVDAAHPRHTMPEGESQ